VVDVVEDVLVVEDDVVGADVVGGADGCPAACSASFSVARTAAVCSGIVRRSRNTGIAA
jgi:hypothetical protein